jgi:hypothetical protein
MSNQEEEEHHPEKEPELGAYNYNVTWNAC